MRRQRTYEHHTRRRSLKGLAGGLLAGILFAACQGDNLFVDFTGTGSVQDGEIPVVNIQQPSSASAAAIPLGDSVLVTADIRDDAGVSRVVFEGISSRGDPALGTDSAVLRFVSKTVDFVPPVPDTTISRYLLALPDTVLETTQIIVTAFDTVGNSAADTLSLILGGPEVLFTNLVGGEVIQSGATLGLRVQARDGAGVRQVEITVTGITGVVPSLILTPISPVLDSLVLDTVVDIPAGVTGTMTIAARAWNTLDVIGHAGPFTVTVTSAVGVDDVPPSVQLTATSNERLELQDLVHVEVRSVDNNQGSGIARTGYTVLGISPTRGDTIIISDEVTFASPRTGTVQQIFDFGVFNMDPLQLPDTLVYEVYGYAVDASGNCGAAVGDPELISLVCGDLAGNTIAQDRTGQRLIRVIVGGSTVLLPSGGTILDGVIDPVRRNLYLSNFDLNRIEVFRLEEEAFLPAVAVGSQPWGLALNNCYGAASPGCGDTLLVANSGGTNITSIDLGPLSGASSGAEDPGNRILTPDNLVFNVSLELTEVGTIWSVEALNVYSDRPQFLAMDQNRQIHFSTWPTDVRSEKGTIRRAFVPAPTVAVPNPNPEVQFHGIQIPGPGEDNAWGILHIDHADLGRSPIFDMFDHLPGDLSAGITERVDTDLIDLTHYPNFLATGSDMSLWPKPFTVDDLGLTDTTFVAASGDGRAVAFGEGNAVLEGRRIMVYQAVGDTITAGLQTEDLGINKDDFISGLGLNFDASLGVARGKQAYFFTMDLRLQGIAELAPGGAGAVMHPLHANAVALDNPAGTYLPNTHMAFVGSGANTIDVYDTFHFFQSGHISIKDVISGPLRAVLPFPADNAGFTCATVAINDRDGNFIGNAVEVFNNNDFNDPHPAVGGPTEDSCVVVKLFGISNAGGMVVVNVRKSDVLRIHPSRP